MFNILNYQFIIFVRLKLRFVIILLPITFYLFSGLNLYAEDPPYKVGETLIYRIMFKAIGIEVEAGFAKIKIKERIIFKGKDALVIETTARSNSNVDNFFMVRDKLTAIWDWKNKRPLQTKKIFNEGNYRRRYQADYDPEKRCATYWQKEIKGNTTKLGEKNKNATWKRKSGGRCGLKPDVQDVISAVYMMRNDPRKPKKGQTFKVPIYDDGRLADITMTIVGFQKLNSPAGKFNTMIIKPKFSTSGFFKHKGEVLVWISNDKNRYPIRVEAHLSIGHATVELVKVR